MTKSDYISKTKNRTKKIIYTKNERQINSNPLLQIWPFFKKIENWGPFLDPHNAQTFQSE